MSLTTTKEKKKRPRLTDAERRERVKAYESLGKDKTSFMRKYKFKTKKKAFDHVAGLKRILAKRIEKPAPTRSYTCPQCGKSYQVRTGLGYCGKECSQKGKGHHQYHGYSPTPTTLRWFA